MTCPQPGCRDCGANQLYARERCNPCYTRHKRALQRAGTYSPLRVEGSTEHRLFAHVTPGHGGCILRTVAIDRDGYSLIRESGGQTRRAHRVSYEIHVGPIPPGLQLDHLCHTRDLGCAGGRGCMHRRCVHPYHLEPVTNRENAARGVIGRRMPAPAGLVYLEPDLRSSLVARRKTLNLSQREVAAAMGVTQPALSALETGRIPRQRRSTVARWVAALDLDAGQLFGDGVAP